MWVSKHAFKQQFDMHTTTDIAKQLKTIAATKVKVDIKMSALKPLLCGWLFQAWQHVNMVEMIRIGWSKRGLEKVFDHSFQVDVNSLNSFAHKQRCSRSTVAKNLYLCPNKVFAQHQSVDDLQHRQRWTQQQPTRCSFSSWTLSHLSFLQACMFLLFNDYSYFRHSYVELYFQSWSWISDTPWEACRKERWERDMLLVRKDWERAMLERNLLSSRIAEEELDHEEAHSGSWCVLVKVRSETRKINPPHTIVDRCLSSDARRYSSSFVLQSCPVWELKPYQIPPDRVRGTAPMCHSCIWHGMLRNTPEPHRGRAERAVW